MCAEVLFVYIILCILCCFLRCHLQNKQLTTLLKIFLYHTGTNTTIMGFATFIEIYCIYRYYNHPSKLLSRVFYVITGVGGPLLLLVPAILQSLLSLKHGSNRRTKSCEFCCKRKQDVELNVNDSQETNPTSHPLNQPSHTYFSIPYTGQFTQVSVTEQLHSEKNEEKSPLIA